MNETKARAAEDTNWQRETTAPDRRACKGQQIDGGRSIPKFSGSDLEIHFSGDFGKLSGATINRKVRHEGAKNAKGAHIGISIAPRYILVPMPGKI